MEESTKFFEICMANWVILMANCIAPKKLIRRLLGTTVRIAPNEVAVSDPEAIRVIYGAKPIFAKVYSCLTHTVENRNIDLSLDRLL